MGKKINSQICKLINDGLHYLIGLLIVAFLIYSVIRIHNYFSKDNIPINVPKTKVPNQKNNQQNNQPNNQMQNIR